MHNCVRPEMKVICSVRRFSDASSLDAATEHILLGGFILWIQEAGHGSDQAVDVNRQARQRTVIY